MWADHAHWNRFRRCFNHRGFETHAVTLLSHDTPQDVEGLRRVGIAEYVAQVKAVVKSLPEAPIVIGHSTGALVAQKLAETETLRALVLLSSVAPGGIFALRLSVGLCISGNVVDALLRRPFIIPARNARYGIVNTLTSREQSVVYQSFLFESGRALWDIVRGSVVVDQRSVTCPVLVVVGSEDRATPPAIARRIARKYGADYREYPGQCHFLSASREVMDDAADWVMEQVQ